MQTVSERLEALIAALGYNTNSFSKELGYANNNVTIGRIIADRGKQPSADTLQKIKARFARVNLNWLLTGEGDMLAPERGQYTSMEDTPTLQAAEPPARFDRNAREVTVDMFMKIPLVPVPAQAGYLKGFSDAEYIDELPTFPVIVDRSYRGKYRVFEVSGDSMDDGSSQAICDKDMVLCREVKRDLWCSKLHINTWDFVIVHRSEGITVKRIIAHDTATGHITCHPLNSLYDDFVLDLNDVLELYNVVRIVDRVARR